MAVVGPGCGGGYNHSPAVGGIGKVVIYLERRVKLLLIEFVPFPDRFHVGSIVRFRRGEVAKGEDLFAVFLPDGIACLKDGSAAGLVEEQGTDGTVDAARLPTAVAVEGKRKPVVCPLGGRPFLIGNNGTHPVGERRAVGFLVVGHLFAVDGQFVGIGGPHPFGCTEGQHAEGIIDLCLSVVRLTTIDGAIALAKAARRRGDGVDAHQVIVGIEDGTRSSHISGSKDEVLFRRYIVCLAHLFEYIEIGSG